MQFCNDYHPKIEDARARQVLTDRITGWKLVAPTPPQDEGYATHIDSGYTVSLSMEETYPIIRVGARYQSSLYSKVERDKVKLLGELIVLLELSTWHEERIVMLFDREEMRRPKPDVHDPYPNVVELQANEKTSGSDSYREPQLCSLSRYECLLSLQDGPLHSVAYAMLPHEWTKITRRKMTHKSGFDLNMDEDVVHGVETKIVSCYEYYHSMPRRLRIAKAKCLMPRSCILDLDVPHPRTVSVYADARGRVGFNRSADWVHLETWIPRWLWLRQYCGTPYISNLHGF